MRRSPSGFASVAAVVLCAVVLPVCAGTSAAAPVARHELDFQVREGLNINCLVREGKVAAHLVARSGKDPRILVAFPAGNSGVGLWFAHLQRPAGWEVVGRLQPGAWPDARGRALYGVSAQVRIRAPELRIAQAVLSSVRVLRDYQALGTVPERVATAPTTGQGRVIRWARDRIDGAPGYRLDLEVVDGDLQGERITAAKDGTIGLRITAASGEPALTPLSGRSLLNDAAPADQAARNALTFLSYREKFLAGSWRFNTYFGRDSLMSVRLLMPVLTAEAVDDALLAVLRRLSDQGEVAHEEDIGEFAILDHLRTDGSMSDVPVFDYRMIDGNYMLAPIASAWLLDDARARQGAASFLSGGDGRGGEHPTRSGDDLVANLRLVLNSAAAFANDPKASNLLGLKPGQTAGQWRDSADGLAGGHYPYDVNAALVPAALEAASRLYASGLLDPYLAEQERPLFSRAADMAKVWRERAPDLFDVQVSHAAAVEAITTYAARLGVPARDALASLGAADERFHAVALDATGSPLPVMHSDEGFALLFGRPDAQGLQQAVDLLSKPFPAGLMTGAGMVVANPVFCSPEVQARLTRNAYHGTVVWSWQQALFAAGLERQLQRRDIPAELRSQLLRARKILWSAIEASRRMNNSELWSWSYSGGRYRIAPFGAAGADADESNAVQLWSTVYLAVRPGG